MDSDRIIIGKYNATYGIEKIPIDEYMSGNLYFPLVINGTPCQLTPYVTYKEPIVKQNKSK